MISSHGVVCPQPKSQFFIVCPSRPLMAAHAGNSEGAMHIVAKLPATCLVSRPCRRVVSGTLFYSFSFRASSLIISALLRACNDPSRGYESRFNSAESRRWLSCDQVTCMGLHLHHVLDNDENPNSAHTMHATRFFKLHRRHRDFFTSH